MEKTKNQNTDPLQENLETEMPKPSEFYNVLLLGNVGIGKTTLLLNYIDEKVHYQTKPTLGTDFKVKSVEHQGENVSLKIYDTAGLERYSSMISTEIKRANTVIVCYAINDRASFENLPVWFEKIRDHDSGIRIILVGNKLDLASDSRRVTYQEGKEFSEKF